MFLLQSELKDRGISPSPPYELLEDFLTNAALAVNEEIIIIPEYKLLKNS